MNADSAEYPKSILPSRTYSLSKKQKRAGFALNNSMVCQHCGTCGSIATRPQKVKKGISGAKATGAVLTLGWSMLATGLSRKEIKTEATCVQCEATWIF